MNCKFIRQRVDSRRPIRSNTVGDASSHERIIAGSKRNKGVQRPEDTARKNGRRERFLSKRQKRKGERERERREENAVRRHENERSENVATYDPIFDRHNVCFFCSTASRVHVRAYGMLVRT